MPPTLAFLDRLNINSLDGYPVRDQVVGLVAHHLKPGMWFKATGEVGDGAFRRLAQKVDLELLARLARADCLGRSGRFRLPGDGLVSDRARALGVEHRPPAPLLWARPARDGPASGPRVGEVLRQVYERQMDGSITSLDQARALSGELLRAREAGRGPGRGSGL